MISVPSSTFTVRSSARAGSGSTTKSPPHRETIEFFHEDLSHAFKARHVHLIVPANTEFRLAPDGDYKARRRDFGSIMGWLAQLGRRSHEFKIKADGRLVAFGPVGHNWSASDLARNIGLVLDYLVDERVGAEGALICGLVMPPMTIEDAAYLRERWDETKLGELELVVPA